MVAVRPSSRTLRSRRKKETESGGRARESSVTGVLFSGITVRYRKQGAGSFTTKTVLAGEWNEIGDGVYQLTFTGSELDTAGFFRYLVTGAGFEIHEADLQVIDDFQTLAQQIVSIRTDLTTKVGIQEADTLVAEQELRLKEAEQRLRDYEKRIRLLQASVAALRGS